MKEEADNLNFTFRGDSLGIHEFDTDIPNLGEDFVTPEDRDKRDTFGCTYGRSLKIGISTGSYEVYRKEEGDYLGCIEIEPPEGVECDTHIITVAQRDYKTLYYPTSYFV